MDPKRKRKRDDDADLPRITYHAPNRTFERLFQEDCLDATKKVIRKKLGLTDDVSIELAQLRGDKSIDLEDDDDFAAFKALAYSSTAVDIRVRLIFPSGGSAAQPRQTKVPPTQNPKAVDQELPSEPAKKRKRTIPDDPKPTIEPVVAPVPAPATDEQPPKEPKKKKKKLAPPLASDEAASNLPVAAPEGHTPAPANANVQGKEELSRKEKKRKARESKGHADGIDASHKQNEAPSVIVQPPPVPEAPVAPPKSAATTTKPTKQSAKGSTSAVSNVPRRLLIVDTPVKANVASFITTRPSLTAQEILASFAQNADAKAKKPAARRKSAAAAEKGGSTLVASQPESSSRQSSAPAFQPVVPSSVSALEISPAPLHPNETSVTAVPTINSGPQRKSKSSSADQACPVCCATPFHFRFRCPVVIAGPESMQRRIGELEKQYGRNDLVRDLEKRLQKIQDKTASQDIASSELPTEEIEANATLLTPARTSASLPQSPPNSQRPPSLPLWTHLPDSSLTEVTVEGRDEGSSSEDEDMDDAQEVDLSQYEGVDMDAFLHGSRPRPSIDSLRSPVHSNQDEETPAELEVEEEELPKAKKRSSIKRLDSVSSSDEQSDSPGSPRDTEEPAALPELTPAISTSQEASKRLLQSTQPAQPSQRDNGPTEHSSDPPEPAIKLASSRSDVGKPSATSTQRQTTPVPIVYVPTTPGRSRLMRDRFGRLPYSMPKVLRTSSPTEERGGDLFYYASSDVAIEDAPPTLPSIRSPPHPTDLPSEFDELIDPPMAPSGKRSTTSTSVHQDEDGGKTMAETADSVKRSQLPIGKTRSQLDEAVPSPELEEEESESDSGAEDEVDAATAPITPFVSQRPTPSLPSSSQSRFPRLSDLSNIPSSFKKAIGWSLPTPTQLSDRSQAKIKSSQRAQEEPSSESSDDSNAEESRVPRNRRAGSSVIKRKRRGLSNFA